MLLKKSFRVVLLILVIAAFGLSVASAQDEGFPEGTSISILQWSHFVPRYDRWFDEYAANWGTANGVGVTVDHINLAELVPSLAAQIEAGAGYSLIELSASPASFIEGLHDLTDVNMAVQALYGAPQETCLATSYLPRTDSFYAFTHAYVPDPGNYLIDIWTDAGYPEGPKTYEDLLVGGALVRQQSGIPLGIGMSPELDSEMAGRALIWSFGGSIQDENENVVLNSPETIAAVNFMNELYKASMTDEVFAWTAASNNQGLIAGSLSYILNSISAYRSQQRIDAELAANIGFSPVLAGPAGAFASSHIWQIYVIPNYVQGAELEAAKQFIIDHVGASSDAVFSSELYNFPCYPPTVPELDGWLAEDPFDSQPIDKLLALGDAVANGVWVGYPGYANPAIGQVFNEYVISSMFARVALGEMTAEESVAVAAARVETIFNEWRAKGLVGGGE